VIIALGNIESANNGTTKTVSVFALEDGTGGTETLQFTIIDQHVTQQETFQPNQGKTVTVTHTASGKGLVIASAVGSKESAMAFLHVDKQPGDKGV
jgi:hypothetical protein